jgi:diguanylate cyclase (GGDEF)-like protein/putative nucleotidyltransferase with HDIG domain
MRLFGPEVPARIRAFFLIVIGCGVLTLSYSLVSVFAWTSYTWLFLACFTIVSSLFPVRLPVLRGNANSLSVTVSDIFIFSAILLYSPEVAVTLSVLDGWLAAMRADRTKKPLRILYNLSQLAVTTWLVGHLFYRLLGETAPLHDRMGIPSVALFLNIGLCALIHFFLNSGSVALAVALTSGQRWFKVFSENLLWASLTTVAGAAGAAIIYLNFERTPIFAFAVTLPIVLVIYSAYKMNLKRIRQARRHLEELDDLYQATITSLAMAIEAKDHNSYGNVQKVKAMTLGLARHLGMTDENLLKGLRAASLLHDIGKLAVPEYILNKPGKLSEVEAAKVRSHPGVGADILETVPFPYPVVPFVRHHHERWDGSGYPDGLSGEQIPLGARILSVVDCYFGLRSDRPFRPKLSRDLASTFIRQEEGRAFDPTVVKVFLENLTALEQAADAVDTEGGMEPLQRAFRDQADGVRPLEREVFRDIASTHREIQAVYEISQNIGRSLSVAETMSYLSTRIKRFVPYSACVIYLVNSDERLLPHHVAGMFRDILEGVEIRLGDGVSGWVGANNKPLLNASAGLDFPNLEPLSRTFRSSLAIPLTVDADVVGVVTLYSDTLNTYTEQHLRLMEAVAGHAAAAISNALIHEEAQEDAYTDALTGLPNIRYFNVMIVNELKRARTSGSPVSVLMMDLDGFKSVNDRYGHKNGDALLIEVARLLRSQLRKSDVCLRYGGDEFVGILPGVDRSLGEQTARRIQQAFEDRGLINVEGENVGVGISVGVATFPADGIEPETLLAAADRDMYVNKARRPRPARPELSIVPFEKRERR